MKTVYLFLATGFEEIEALTIVDMLRRAEIDITTVSISRNLQVEGAHGITVTADCTWVELSTEDADWLILPGGMPGTKTLGRMQTVGFFIATPSRCQQEHRYHLCRSVGSGSGRIA